MGRTASGRVLDAALEDQMPSSAHALFEPSRRARILRIDPRFSNGSFGPTAYQRSGDWLLSRTRRSALRVLARLDQERAIHAAMARLHDSAPSVRTAAVEILCSSAGRVDFDGVSRRVRSLSDPKARGSLLRVFLDAPKWEAPVFLLETLTDPDDGVRTVAASLVDKWIEGFNRKQTQPTAKQLQRIGALVDSVASRMPEETARTLRFIIRPS